jgi:outer membrane protein assembly factor BamB
VTRQPACSRQPIPRHRAIRNLAAAILCGLLAACASAPQLQTTLLDKPSFSADWHAQVQLTSGESVASIYIVGDMIHVLTDQNFDHAFKIDSGELLYFNQVAESDQTIKGGPALLPDDAVVIAFNRTLVVYNNHGRLQRTIDTDYAITSPPFVNKRMVYIGLDETGGRFAAIDVYRDINPMRWDVLTFGLVDGKSGVHDRQIFVGAEDGAVRALYDDGDAPAMIWASLRRGLFTTTGGKILSSVRADNYGVYFASTDSIVYCVDRDTGKEKWRFFAGAILDTAPEVTADTVYQYIPGKGVAAIDKISKLNLNLPDQHPVDENPVHTARWTVENAVRFLSQDDKYAYLQSSSNTILAVDKQSGAQVFESQRQDLTVFTTNTETPMIYAATANGLVLAIRPMPIPGTYGQIVFNVQPAAATAMASAR